MGSPPELGSGVGVRGAGLKGLHRGEHSSTGSESWGGVYQVEGVCDRQRGPLMQRRRSLEVHGLVGEQF